MRITKDYILRRNTDGVNCTLGQITLNGNNVCKTLEDPITENKIPGKSAIPGAKTYNIRLRKVISGKTRKYRKRFNSFFSWHLELQDVENFDYIYLHVGNDPEDTEGCILLGSAISKNKKKIVNSVDAYKKFYIATVAALMRGELVTITII